MACGKGVAWGGYSSIEDGIVLMLPHPALKIRTGRVSH